MATLTEKKHMNRVAELGCVICKRNGNDDTPAQLHHLRTGGWGKGGALTLIPLCYEHHVGDTGIHGMGTKAFERHYGVTQQQLLDWVLEQTGVKT
jgi:hypothetical protein